MKIIIINNFGFRLVSRKDVLWTRSMSAPDVSPVGLIKVIVAPSLSILPERWSGFDRLLYGESTSLFKSSLASRSSCRKAIPTVDSFPEESFIGLRKAIPSKDRDVSNKTRSWL